MAARESTVIVMTGFRFFAGVVILLLASILVYTLRGHRRDPDAEHRGTHFILGFGDFLLDWLLWLVSPLVDLAEGLGLPPTAFNVIGLLFGLASGLLIAMGHLELGGWAIVIGGICDILDGRLARRSGRASDFGHFIDSTFDRYFEMSTFLGFAWYLAGPWPVVGPLVALGALGGSMLVSYVRARGEVLGVKCTGGLMPRAERLVLTALVCLVDPTLSYVIFAKGGTIAVLVLALMTGATLATAVYRTVRIARRLGSRSSA